MFHSPIQISGTTTTCPRPLELLPNVQIFGLLLLQELCVHLNPLLVWLCQWFLGLKLVRSVDDYNVQCVLHVLPAAVHWPVGQGKSTRLNLSDNHDSKDVNDRYCLQHPRLYRLGQQNKLFNLRIFFYRFFI